MQHFSRLEQKDHLDLVSWVNQIGWLTTTATHPRPPPALPVGESDYLAKGDHWTEIECIVKGLEPLQSDPGAPSVRVTLEHIRPQLTR